MCAALQGGRVTLQDIARKTGYTANTVSRALKNKSDVAVETRQRIQQVARELGYVPNYTASALRSGRTRSIGLILGEMSNPYYAANADAIHDAVFALGYSLLTLCSRENPEQELQAVETALSRQVDGILLFPSHGAEESAQRLRAAGVPYVLMSRSLSPGMHDCVMCNEEEGGYLATRHLIDAGRRCLAFLCGVNIVHSTEYRLKGFLRACEEAGIPEEDRRVEISNDGARVRSTLSRWREEGVDGLFVFCDMEAWSAIYDLQDAGVRVPEDMAVVGYDNIQGRIHFPMPLCTVDPSIDEMIRQALALLRRRIHHDDAPPETILVPARIVCRGSCGQHRMD
ncbi:MAG: LacI family DNA-binding transcriptional regulator [Clostridia bacterium]|nr:LacI family DNA-binding transcriptional regulator [Clostridia bacterium]